jgi:hypothetical protein
MVLATGDHKVQFTERRVPSGVLVTTSALTQIYEWAEQ